ncbi:DUF1330 domain-containing protein [Azospirillum sp. YIM B02556]|uniref:DUF1330 domain-containing protein n=1 Tax=Azospirillum endophyticum TaxID=2800326 RepID=A0ABS1FHT9_9PROT|nr:DUF1330 domain-containing protein [Azospirillum endophyticum]MBK1842898.1 DUF1330 domain-containing protein [Azospirillum endophyticum]
MEGHTSFTRQTLDAFRAADRPGPVHMLNLIRLREWAVYEDGQDAAGRAVTGLEAYQAYGRLSAPVLAELGGRILWRGGFELSLVGPPDAVWDIAFIAEYPSPAAFVAMLRDPRYREAMAHRQAGVADSRLIRCSALPPGTGFAG